MFFDHIHALPLGNNSSFHAYLLVSVSELALQRAQQMPKQYSTTLPALRSLAQCPPPGPRVGESMDAIAAPSGRQRYRSYGTSRAKGGCLLVRQPAHGRLFFAFL